MSKFIEDPADGKGRQAPSLIESLIIIAILAALSATAMPFMRDAAVREKISACLDRAGVVREHISQHHRIFGEWPESLHLSQQARVLVSADCNGFTGYDPLNGAFKLNVNEDSIAPGVVSLQPLLRPNLNDNGSIRWQCTRGDTLPEQVKLLPEQCRGLNS